MPITELQKRIFQLLSQNRSESSYIAGASVIHLSEHSSRFSQDIDIFHDSVESLAESFEKDSECLTKNGISLEPTIRQPSFIRVQFRADDGYLKMDWAHDSSWRFFPLEKDELLGARLSIWDAATNKVLACAGREAPRDVIDLIYLDRVCLPLGALVWAAAGKDEGYTPALLCEQLRWHGKITQEQLDKMALTQPLNVQEVKAIWLDLIQRAEEYVKRLPAADLGCFYLHPESRVPFASHVPTQSLQRHFASNRGAWPKVADEPVPIRLPERLDL